MAKLTVVSSELQGKSLEIGDKEVLVVGRDSGCDLVLDHADTSRKHAELRQTPQGLMLKDLGSTNGTKVNGQKVDERLLKNGDEITFGTVKARAELPADPSTKVRSTKVRAAFPRLIGPDGKETAVDSEVFVVGRESGCNLVIASEEVSARHAELRRTPQGLMLKDLGSTNGTLVNGKKISEKLLADGDEVTFAAMKYKAVLDGPSAEAAAKGTVVRPAISPQAAPPAFQANEAAKGGKSKAMLWVVIAVVVVGAAVAGAWLLKGKPGPAAPDAPTTAQQTAAQPQAAQPPSVGGQAPAQQPAVAGQVVERLVFNHVWSYTTGEKVISSPAVGDVNGDRVLDVAVGSNDGMIYLLDGRRGALLWRFRTDGPVQSSPLLIDLTGDGQLDIVAGSDGGRVYALDGNGRKIWEAPEDLQAGAGSEFQSSPAAAELNAQAPVDIVIGCQNGRVYALSGQRGWPIWETGTIMKGGVFATPALADVNGDGVSDALVGSQDNIFYCLSGKNGWKMWQFVTKAPVKASAALGDLDRDGRPEVILASTDGTIYALHAADGVELWRYESGVPVEASVELADLNRDGVPDVVAALSNGKLTALNGKNGLRVWEFDMAGANVVSSPVTHDLNGDGAPDIIVVDAKGLVHAVSGTTGWELANFQLNAGAVSTPALADLNGDGMLDVVLGVEDNNVVVLTINTPVAKDAVIWPNFRANAARTGR